MRNTTVIASAIALALGISACSEQKTLEQLLASANEYSQKRDFSSAVLELKNAVRLSPKNAEARFALGHAYLEQGNYIFAEKELEKSLALGINLSNAAPLMAQIKAKLAKYDELQALVEKSTDIHDNDYIKVLIYAGISALAHNEREKAQDYIGQAISISENAAYSQLGKAYLAQSEDDYVQSLVDIEAVLVENPNFSEALLLKAHLQFYLKDYEQAAGAFGKYIARHPLDYSINYFEINSLIKANLFEQAEIKTDNLLKVFNSAPLTLHYKAQLQYQKQNYKEAKNTAEQAISAGSTLPLTKLIAGTSAFQLKDYEQAYNHFRPLEAFLPISHPIKRIIAVVKLQLGYGGEASDDIMSLEGLANKDLAFLQASASSLIELGNFEEAEKLLSRADLLQPNNTSIKIQKGFLLLSQNDISGIDELTRAIELNPQLDQIQVDLIITYMRTNQDHKAFDIAREMQLIKRTAVLGHLLEGLIYSKQRKTDKEKAKYKQVLLLEPNHVSANYYLGLLAAKSKETILAIEYFKNVVNQYSGHYDSINRIIAINLQRGKIDESELFFNEIQQRYPDDINPILARSVNLYAANDIKGAIKLLESYRENSITNDKFWLVLAELNKHNNNVAESIKIYKEQLEKNTKNTKIRLALISTFVNSGNLSSVISEADKGLLAEPENDQYNLIKAKIWIKEEKFPEASRIIEKLLKENPNSINVLKLVAEVSKLTKNYKKEAEAYTAIYIRTQKSEHLVNLALALDKDGRRKEAIEKLSSYLSKRPNVSIQVLLAEYQITESTNKALDSYYQLLAEAPNNIVLLNNIAWSELKLGNISDAKTHAEKAFQLAGSNPKIMDTYGLVLLTNNEISKAVDIFNRAHELAKDDHEITLHLAQALIENNDLPAARLLVTNLQVDDPKLSDQLEQLKIKL